MLSSQRDLLRVQEDAAGADLAEMRRELGPSDRPPWGVLGASSSRAVGEARLCFITFVL